MAKHSEPMEVDNARVQRRPPKGVSSERASKKEERRKAKKEKKKLAKMVRNKKMAAEFSNHKPKASKNTTERLSKNCY